jgi:hypothetical protein
MHFSADPRKNLADSQIETNVALKPSGISPAIVASLLRLKLYFVATAGIAAGARE